MIRAVVVPPINLGAQGHSLPGDMQTLVWDPPYLPTIHSATILSYSPFPHRAPSSPVLFPIVQMTWATPLRPLGSSGEEGVISDGASRCWAMELRGLGMWLAGGPAEAELERAVWRGGRGIAVGRGGGGRRWRHGQSGPRVHQQHFSSSSSPAGGDASPSHLLLHSSDSYSTDQNFDRRHGHL
jgi:hypothetical protein